MSGQFLCKHPQNEKKRPSRRRPRWAIIEKFLGFLISELGSEAPTFRLRALKFTSISISIPISAWVCSDPQIQEMWQSLIAEPVISKSSYWQTKIVNESKWSFD